MQNFNTKFNLNLFHSVEEKTSWRACPKCSLNLLIMRLFYEFVSKKSWNISWSFFWLFSYPLRKCPPKWKKKKIKWKLEGSKVIAISWAEINHQILRVLFLTCFGVIIVCVVREKTVTKAMKLTYGLWISTESYENARQTR